MATSSLDHHVSSHQHPSHDPQRKALGERARGRGVRSHLPEAVRQIQLPPTSPDHPLRDDGLADETGYARRALEGCCGQVLRA